MRTLKSAIHGLKELLLPKRWEKWQFETAQLQSHSDYTTIEAHLMSFKQTPKFYAVFDNQSIDETTESGIQRQRVLRFLNELLMLLWPITGFFFIGTIVTISLKLEFRTLSYAATLAVVMTVTILLTLLASMLAQKARSLSSTRIERPLIHYASKNHLKHVPVIEQKFTKIRDMETSIFVSEANGEVKRVKNKYWTTDNWQLGIISGFEGRKAVALIGEPPSGDFLFLKSELDTLSPPIGQQQANGELHNRNSRTNILQKDALQTHITVRRLIKVINQKHPKNALGKRKRFSKEQSARLDALEYISKNPKFWNLIRDASKTINDTSNHDHRKELLKIFAPIARNRSTLGEPGLTLMEEFIGLKDRLLETWLHKLGWEISG